jgi:hypothetical protein
MHILKTFTYSLTPWSEVLLEKLTDSQLVKKLPVFCPLENFKVPASCPYSEPDQSTPCFTLNPIYILLIP